MRAALWALIAATGIVIAGACGKAPVAPTGAATDAALDLYSGTWSGSLIDDALGAGIAQLMLGQQAVGWKGSWSVTFTRPNRISGAAGSAWLLPNGRSPSSPPVLQLFCGSNSQNTSLDVKVDSNHHLTGSYTNGPAEASAPWTPCIGMAHGTLDFAKQ